MWYSHKKQVILLTRCTVEIYKNFPIVFKVKEYYILILYPVMY